MEQESISQQVPYVPPPEQKKGSFLVLGIAEVIFLVILAVVIAGVLNYYNILPISSLNPTYFSWLPHPIQDKQSQNKKSAQQIIIPTPSILQNQLSITTKTKSFSEKNDILSLPLSPTHPLVQIANLSYGLKGKVRKLKPTKNPDEYQLLFDQPLPDTFPPIILNKDTIITERSSTGPKQLRPSDLVPNTVVFVAIQYDLKSNNIIVSSVGKISSPQK